MSKRERPPITVKAYVKVNGVETDVDTLDEARRGQLATAIQVTVLNTFLPDVRISTRRRPGANNQQQEEKQHET